MISTCERDVSVASSAFLPGATLVLSEPSRFLPVPIEHQSPYPTAKKRIHATIIQRILCSSTSQLKTSRGQDHPASRQLLQKRNNRWQIGVGYKGAEMRPSTCPLPRFLLSASPSHRPGHSYIDHWQQGAPMAGFPRPPPEAEGQHLLCPSTHYTPALLRRGHSSDLHKKK